MPSKYGGIPIEQGSKYGGIPILEKSPEPEKKESGLIDKFKGAGEVALSAITGSIGNVASGYSGIRSLAQGGPADKTVKQTQEAITYQPRTEKGKEYLEDVGDLLRPISEAIEAKGKKLGDFIFEKTNSPSLSAFGATVPSAIVEILGLKSFGAIPKELSSAKNIINNKMKAGKIARNISEAAPDIEQLKTAARGIYKEIDDSGTIVKPDAYSRLVNQIKRETDKLGIDKDLTPKSTKAVSKFDEFIDQSVPITELDKLRQKADVAAMSAEPAERMLGGKIKSIVDDFLEKADANDLLIPEGGIDISKKYKLARDLWGRARKSELLQEAFEKARNQASGFENGVRSQFRTILNNKKLRRSFNEEELTLMKKVVRGDSKTNFAKLIGRFGFSEGGAKNVGGAALGAVIGGSVAGVPGAVIVPIIGQTSRKLAQRLTVKNAEFLDQVIRAGKNGKKITNAYLKNTPKELIDPAELSELLMRSDIDLSGLNKPGLESTAKSITESNRKAQLSGVIIADTDVNDE